MFWKCPYTGIELSVFCACGDEPYGYFAKGMHSREAMLVAAMSAYVSDSEEHCALWCDEEDVAACSEDIMVAWCWVDRESIEGCETVFRGSAPGEPGGVLVTYISREGVRLLGEHVPYQGMHDASQGQTQG